METREKKVETGALRSNRESKRGVRIVKISLFILSLFILPANVTFAHCDTMDGPLIGDARKALAQNNVNYALKWISAANESEIRDAFNLVMKVKGLGPEAKELSEKYFFDTLVRIHRAGEGVPFTGVKPSGTPVDEKVLAADKSIETGDLTPLKVKISEDDIPELTERFEKVMSLKNFDVNNVEAGREYIEAYVQFFKVADKCHHGKEEVFLFPALEKAGVRKEGGPIGVMLLEHTKGRILIKEMQENILNNLVNKTGFITAASEYVRHMRAHIEKENRVLFPAIETRMSASEQKELFENFENHEEKVIGKGRHEELHNLLDKFRNKYLN